MSPASVLTFQRVRPAMFDSIHADLLTLLDPNRPKEAWRWVFHYGWSHSEDHVGYAIRNHDGWAGYLGLVFSEVFVAGRLERICNVTSWVAKETYRRESIQLVFPLRDLHEYTITNLTCTEPVFRIFSQLGFEVLESHRTILGPILPGSRASRAPHCQIESDPAAIGPQLTGETARIFQDHLVYANHLLVRAAEGTCYIVYTLGRRKLLRTARIHFISEKTIFARYWARLQRCLLFTHGAILAECDSRLVAGVSLPASRTERRPIPRLFKSSRLSPLQITNLYSELVLLNLP